MNSADSRKRKQLLTRFESIFGLVIISYLVTINIKMLHQIGMI